jgi:glycosyl transferase family 87
VSTGNRLERPPRFWIAGAQVAAFCVLPALLTAFLLQVAVTGHLFAVDFGNGPWVAGRQLFAGLSPYVGTHSPQLAHNSPFVYPAAAAILLAPLSVLSNGAAEGTFTALSIAAVLLTLRVLSVKDWRLYGVALMWPPVISGWQTANLTLLLGLGIAIVWRHRDRPLVAGAVTALLVSVKMFVWPLGLWLLATKRYAALGYAVGCGVIVNVLAWAVLGFDQLGRYLHLMEALTKIQERRSYSVLGLALGHGLGRAAAYEISLAAAAVAAVACVAVGSRGIGRPAFALSIAACLLSTPIIWLHYFALLLVPLAIARPRLSLIWFAPLLLQFPASTPERWQIVVTLIVAGAVTVAALTQPRSRRAPRELALVPPPASVGPAVGAPAA